MKRLLILLLLSAAFITLNLFTFAVGSTEPVKECNIVNKQAIIDGKVTEGEWDGATALVLNVSDTNNWKAHGAGIVGGKIPENYTDDDFSNTVKLMIKDGYLYYLETRKDSTMFFGAKNETQPYTQDGSIFWFVDAKTGKLKTSLSVFPYNTIANSWMVKYNPNGDEGLGSDIDDIDAKFCKDENGYIFEAKIALDEIGLSEEKLLQEKLKVTYCTVNIIDTEFSGEASELWGENYQAQYTGVGDWLASPDAKYVNEDGSAITLPETTKIEADTEAKTTTELQTESSKPDSQTSAETTSKIVSEESNQSTAAGADSDSNNNSLIVVIVLVAVVVVAAIIIIIVKHKKR